MGFFAQTVKDIIYVRAALRTLKRLGEVHKNPTRTFADVIEDFAHKQPDSIAIYFEGRAISYSDYNGMANRYARWALAQGIGRGDVVALLMENRPEYLIAWLGIIKVGASAALINTNLVKGPLAHSLNISGAHHIVLGAELAETYATCTDQLAQPMTAWSTGGKVAGLQNLDAMLGNESDTPLSPDLRKGLTTQDNALFIYTSGTTGAPKAARIPHIRLLGIMAAFSAGANGTAKDRMYIVLPLYHSAGGLCATGTVLTVGGAVILRRKFSASEFWSDIHRYDATMFQYIGELCRYLLNTEKNLDERKHHLRMVVGNGLRPEIWPSFQSRFKIPRVLEFYGATEGNIALMNFDGTVGAIGRVPKWAKKRFNVELIRFDIDEEKPVRGADGFCQLCAYDEPGEAIGKITNDPNTPTGRFEGYAKKEETEKKILRDVFEKGDAWFRSGDLMRQDRQGYFYFVDRIGDTFRWKGENVSTAEVSQVISVFPGVKEANIYGVAVAGKEGRAGMASLVVDAVFDMQAFRSYLERELPAYARPLFLRLQQQIEVTGTFKQRKIDLVIQGFNPTIIKDPLYFNSHEDKAFVPLDQALFDLLRLGEIRL